MPFPLISLRRRGRFAPFLIPAALMFFVGALTCSLEAQTAPSFPVPSGAIYASPNGSPTGLGTQSSPIALSVAPSRLQNGDTLVLRGGTYSGVSELGLSIPNLTIQNAPGETVWLRGDTNVSGGWTTEILESGRTVWRRDGWNHSFPHNGGAIYIDPNYPAAGLRDTMTQNGAPLQQVVHKTDLVEGTFWVDSTNKRLYLGNAPSADLTATVSKRAISVWQGVAPNGYAYTGNGTKIRGLNFRGFADEGIIIGAPNVSIENCHFEWNGLQGVSVASNNRVNTGVVLRDCRFVSNGLKGVSAYRVNDLLVENCVFDGNNAERFSVHHDAAGIKFVGCRGVTIRDCIVADNLANGIWFDVSCFDSRAYRNDVRGNSKGIFCEISHRNWLAFNLLRHNETGLSIAGSSQTRVYNNTLAFNGVNLEVMDDGRTNDPHTDGPLNQGAPLDGNPFEIGENSEEAAMGATWWCRDNTLVNNLLWGGSGVSQLKADWSARSEATSLMVSSANFNAYGCQNGTHATHKWNLGSQQFRLYAALANFRAANPSFEINSLHQSASSGQNPYFVNAGSGDFRLHEDSLAVNAGAPLPLNIATELSVAQSPQHIGAMTAYFVPRVLETSAHEVVADAFVRDGSSAASNFGTLSELQIKRDATVGFSRQSHLRFDVSALRGKIQSVKLRLFGNLPAGTEAFVAASPVADDGWGETLVTWNNAPAGGSEITQTRVAGTTNTWYEWDVTEAAKSAVAGDKLLSLKLECAQVGIALARFNSRENSANRPQIVVESLVPVETTSGGGSGGSS